MKQRQEILPRLESGMQLQERLIGWKLISGHFNSQEFKWMSQCLFLKISNFCVNYCFLAANDRNMQYLPEPTKGRSHSKEDLWSPRRAGAFDRQFDLTCMIHFGRTLLDGTLGHSFMKTHFITSNITDSLRCKDDNSNHYRSSYISHNLIFPWKWFVKLKLKLGAFDLLLQALLLIGVKQLK